MIKFILIIAKWYLIAFCLFVPTYFLANFVHVTFAAVLICFSTIFGIFEFEVKQYNKKVNRKVKEEFTYKENVEEFDKLEEKRVELDPRVSPDIEEIVHEFTTAPLEKEKIEKEKPIIADKTYDLSKDIEVDFLLVLDENNLPTTITLPVEVKQYFLSNQIANGGKAFKEGSTNTAELFSKYEVLETLYYLNCTILPQNGVLGAITNNFKEVIKMLETEAPIKPIIKISLDNIEAKKYANDLQKVIVEKHITNIETHLLANQTIPVEFTTQPVNEVIKEKPVIIKESPKIPKNKIKKVEKFNVNQKDKEIVKKKLK